MISLTPIPKFTILYLATISTLESMAGQPFANIIAFNEGLEALSNGVPYFFVTDMDQSMHDLKKHNFMSLSVSENQAKLLKTRSQNTLVDFFELVFFGLESFGVGKDVEFVNRLILEFINYGFTNFQLLKTKFCRNHGLDPEDPRCARFVLSGSFSKVDPSSPGEFFYLFLKHDII